ncbi:MAG TPA: c-type cytochrome [Rudaea sp.]|nr:c-type cytochrome [Rudaea sp.]
MNKRAVVFLSLCVVCRILHGAEPASDVVESARVLATEVCSICHGPGGKSALPAFPNLAAQPRLYLLAKIKLFRSRSIREPSDHGDMLGLTLIDDATADALARYFADQKPPTPMPGDDALVAAGNKIFVHGDPDRGVAACSACHGANGHGIGIFPRLAGQHAEYVQRQLTLIQTRLRDARGMHGIIKDMTSDEMKAVAAFVQSQ